MDIHGLIVSIYPKTMYSSTKNHSQDPNTCTYYSKPYNGTRILNRSSVVPLGGHLWLVEETFLTMDCYKQHLCLEVQFSSMAMLTALEI